MTNDSAEAKLKRTDRAVLKYLRGLAQKGDGETCKASIPQIAKGSDVSARQVQISTGRLIRAGLLKNVGRDLSNPDFKERGTSFRIVRQETSSWEEALRKQRVEATKILLDICLIFEGCVGQIIKSHEQTSLYLTEAMNSMQRIKDELAKQHKK